MEQFKRVKVLMLPTLKVSKLAIIYDNLKDDGSSTILQSSYMQHSHINNGEGMFFTGWKKPLFQYLYFISDDEIKKGDWFYNGTSILQCSRITDVIIDTNGLWSKIKSCKKIIATTDTSLTEDKRTYISGLMDKPNILPQPSQQFIEKYIECYNKGEVIEDVLVEYEYEDFSFWSGYKNDIQVSNKPKIDNKNTVTIKKLKDSWNRKEVVELLNKLNNTLNIVEESERGYQTIEEFIDKNL